MRLRLRASPVFASMSPEEQDEALEAMLDSATGSGKTNIFETPPEVQGQEAISRLQAERTGSYQYPDPAMRAADLQVLEQQNALRDQALGRARAQDLGSVGAFALGAANTASLGAGSLVRSLLGQEEIGGLEGQAF